jgi:hypothetical protein
MVTRRFKLDDIEVAYDLFANQRDGVFKVAITPWARRLYASRTRRNGWSGLARSCQSASSSVA